MSTRLLSLLAVEWKGFEEFSREGSEAGMVSRLRRFHELVEAAAAPEQGELVHHPVKDRAERRLYVFSGPSACLRVAVGLGTMLEGEHFAVSVALHAGECFTRGGTVVGTPIREVAALAEQATAGGLLATEVFRLTVPVEALVSWSRQDSPAILAGTPWILYRLEPRGDEAEASRDGAA